MKTLRQRKRSTSPRPIPHVLLLVETAGSFGRGIIEGIGRYVAENGPWSIKYEYRALDSLPPKWLKQWKGDGIITRTFNAKQAKMLQGSPLPCVELLGQPKFGTAEVRSNFSEEARLAADHFWDHGLRQFAYFSFGDSWWMRECREPFVQLLNKSGCECHIYPSPPGQDVHEWDDRHQPQLRKWLRALPRPIGILTPGDLHAVHLLDLCRELKIAVPEEMAILGRGNDPVICGTVRPTLSSLDLDARRIGYEAAQMLDLKIAGKKVQGPVLISPIGVAIRQSTDLMIIENADVVESMRFIQNFACKGIDVLRVAEHVGLSRRVLERRFFQYLGRTPKAEIMRVRIDRAKMLLAKTDRSRESISQCCGFNSPQYFSKVFHRLVGMKLHAYRKMMRVSRDLGVE